jgi:hypothetical protein
MRTILNVYGNGEAFTIKAAPEEEYIEPLVCA